MPHQVRRESDECIVDQMCETVLLRMKGMRVMKPITKVLFCADLSSNSVYAFTYAVDFARRYDAELTVLHIVEEFPKSLTAMLHGLPDGESHVVVMKNSVKRTRDRLNIFCEREKKENPACEGLHISVEVREGYPADEILKAIDDIECDAVIMGTNSKGAVSHAFLGSVAERVLRRTRNPVFIVPIPRDMKEEELTSI